MKFFLSKEFLLKWLIGVVYLLVIRPVAYIIMGPYMEALQQERNKQMLSDLRTQMETIQADEARKRGN